MAPPATSTSSTVSAASVGPPIRTRTGTRTSAPRPVATSSPEASPGIAAGGTVRASGTSARVRGGTVTVSSANRAHAPARPSPRSRTVSGARPELVTVSRSWRAVPGVPSR